MTGGTAMTDGWGWADEEFRAGGVLALDEEEDWEEEEDWDEEDDDDEEDWDEEEEEDDDDGEDWDDWYDGEPDLGRRRTGRLV
jgi:hypothetical protein